MCKKRLATHCTLCSVSNMILKTIWLNKILGHRIEITDAGFDLINEFGYVGTFKSMPEALAANASNTP